MNNQIEAMRKLGLSDAEIADVLEADKRIDKGEKLFELDPELKAGAKKARMAGTRKVDAYGKSTERKHKSDEVKAGLIELFSEVVKEQPMCGQVEILNSEREFTFMWAEKKYKVVLSCPRS